MIEDLDSVRYERDDYKRKMNMAGKTIAVQQEQIDDLNIQIVNLKLDVSRVMVERTGIQNIMTDQLTESNAKCNKYIEYIQTLKNVIKGLKDDNNNQGS